PRRSSRHRPGGPLRRRLRAAREGRGAPLRGRECHRRAGDRLRGALRDAGPPPARGVRREGGRTPAPHTAPAALLDAASEEAARGGALARAVISVLSAAPPRP